MKLLKKNNRQNFLRDSLTGIESLECRRLLSASLSQLVASPDLVVSPDSTGSTVMGYSPTQIEEAYGINTINFDGGTVTGNGAGQTIAIVDAYSDPNITSDLATFDTEFGIAAPPTFTVVSQTGSTSDLPVEDAGWTEEISLDVEWSHAIAPDANIMLVETNSDDLNSLLAGVNYARSTHGVTVVSMSWGSSEYNDEDAYDADFTAPTGHKGITFVAASGDEGVMDGAEWPSVSPNVLSVGGTSLVLNSDGSIAQETAWFDASGGESQIEGEPAYQDVAQSTGARTTADVAYDADPNTGMAVYDSISYEGYVGWMEIGGTSAGAPQWSALIAIADQGRTLEGKGTLNSGSATLPALYALEDNATTYADSFNNITTGSPWAQVGYNLPTGLGSPKAAAIVDALLAVSRGASTGAPISIIEPPPPRIHWPVGWFSSQANIAIVTSHPQIASLMDRAAGDISLSGTSALQVSRNIAAESIGEVAVIDGVFRDGAPIRANLPDIAIAHPSEAPTATSWPAAVTAPEAIAISLAASALRPINSWMESVHLSVGNLQINQSIGGRFAQDFIGALLIAAGVCAAETRSREGSDVQRVVNGKTR